VTAKAVAHPELAIGPNPLLEALGPFIPMSKLPKALRHEPLEHIPWSGMAPQVREVFLPLIDKHYWPITPHLDVCSEIQLMLRGGLTIRNPLSVSEQRRINMIALADDASGMHLQSLKQRAGGAILAAITGMGKSTLVDRALAVFAPNQVVIHSISKECGWSTLTQVVYLIVDAPHNATRHGLLEAIVGSLDRLIGANYSSELRRQRNLDAGVVYVAKVLSNHRVGMLVIDENQEETLSNNHWGEAFILFFLGLMNLGIPVLLMGSPMAFADLNKGAPLTRRFATNGWHELSPAKAFNEKWWRNGFLVGETRFSLCETIPSVERMAEDVFKVVRGVPGFFSALWSSATLLALRRGCEVAELTVQDVEAAAMTPRVRKLAEIARCIDGGGQHSFSDIPPQPSTDGSVQAPSVPGLPSAADLVEAVGKLSGDLKRMEARQNKKRQKDAELRKSLSKDDLRRGVDAMAILAGAGYDQGKLEV
jgi:hypothetical protein